jgi:hypothetical protein
MNEGPTTPRAERPPLGSWRRMYALVLLTDAALIALFTWFTLHFD